MTPLEATDIERLRELLAKAGTPTLALNVSHELPFGASYEVDSGSERFGAWYFTDQDYYPSAPDKDAAEAIVSLVNAAPGLLDTATRVKVLEEALEQTAAYLEEAANVVEGRGRPRLAGILRNQVARARTALTASEDDRGSKGEGRG